ncbi:MAG TPA: integrase [Candidatus Competibacteraceae bacterium]|nr:integrase [Candidatus Competibacteraceae bacterium]
MNTRALVKANASGNLPAHVAQLAESARDYADAGMAANTRRAYAGDWRDFDGWCADMSVTSLPASAETVALYLTDRAGSVSVATLGRRLAAIRTAHKSADAAVPTSGALTQVWAGIRRLHGRPPAPKRAMLLDDVRKAVQAMPNTLAGKRDRALLLVGFGGGLRRSELAAIEIEGPDAGPVRLRFVGGGLEIHLHRSKADQEGRGAVVAIPHGSRLDSCPVQAVKAWLADAAIKAGPVFRGVDRWGTVGGTALTPYAVALVVKAAAERIGLDAEAFAGHSLRAGLATSAAANDAPAHVIMQHMRHARFETTKRYIREGERFTHNAASMAGL